jgi:hypothetical protein
MAAREGSSLRIFLYTRLYAISNNLTNLKNSFTAGAYLPGELLLTIRALG